MSSDTNPFEDTLAFMEQMQEQYQATLTQISTGFESNMALWGDTQNKFSKLWLDNFENLSLALFQTESMPKLDAVMGLDFKIKDFAVAATNLSIAASELQILFMKIWGQAHDTFNSNTADLSPNSKESINQWLENANLIVLQFQQSDEYLEAKKKYATSLTAFQSTYKELIEVYQENNHIPTQREFDDLSNSVYRLKKELRSLRKEMQTLRSSDDE